MADLAKLNALLKEKQQANINAGMDAIESSIKESAALKNVSSPDVISKTDLLDKEMIGDSDTVTRLNRLLNNMPKEDMGRFNSKTFGKDIDTKIKTAEKMYEDSKKTPGSKFMRGFKSTMEQIDSDIKWWEQVGLEKDTIKRAQKEQELMEQDQLMEQKWASDEKPGLMEGVGGLAGSMAAYSKGAVKPAIAGAVAGAGTALVAGAAIPVPEEAITVPGFALGGAKKGYTLGMANAAKHQGSGDIYRDLRINGVDHDTAANVADKAGYLYAGSEYLQLDKIIPGGKKIAGAAFKEIVKNGIKEYGKDVFSNVAQESIQRATTDIAKDIGVYKSQGLDQDQITKKLAADWQKYGANMFEEAVAAAGPMAIVGAPGAVVNTALGKTTGEIKTKTGQETAIEKAQGLLSKYGITPENIQKTVEITKPNGEKVKADAEGLIIRISELADEKTGDHEAFHVIANNFADPEVYGRARNNAMELTGIQDSAKIDEYLADQFADWRGKKEKVSGIFNKLFNQIKEGVSQTFGKDKEMRKLFDAFDKGPQKEVTAPVVKRQYKEEMTDSERIKRAKEAQQRAFENMKQQENIKAQERKSPEFSYYKEKLAGMEQVQKGEKVTDGTMLTKVKRYLAGKNIKVPTTQEGKMVGEYEGLNKQFPGLFSTKQGVSLDDMLTEFNVQEGTNYDESTFRTALKAEQQKVTKGKAKITDQDVERYAASQKGLKEKLIKEYEQTEDINKLKELSSRIAEITEDENAIKELKQKAQEKAQRPQIQAQREYEKKSVKTTKAAMKELTGKAKEKPVYGEKEALKTKLKAEVKAARDAEVVGKLKEKIGNRIKQQIKEHKLMRNKKADNIAKVYRRLFAMIKRKELPIDSYEKISELMHTQPRDLTGFREYDYNNYKQWLDETLIRARELVDKKNETMNREALDRLQKEVMGFVKKMSDVDLGNLYAAIMAEYTEGRQRMQALKEARIDKAILEKEDIRINSIEKINNNGRENYGNKLLDVRRPLTQEKQIAKAKNLISEMAGYYKANTTLEMLNAPGVFKIIDGGKVGAMFKFFMSRLKAGQFRMVEIEKRFENVYKAMTEAMKEAKKGWKQTEKIAGIDMTVQTKIIMRLYKDNKNAMAKLNNMGIKTEQVEEIANSLTEKELNLYKEIRKAIDELTPLLKEKVEKIENVPFVAEEAYFPIRVRPGQGQDFVLDTDMMFTRDNDGKMVYTGFDKGWQKARTSHDYDIEITDLEGLLQGYVDKVSRYMGFSEVHSELWEVEKQIEPLLAKKYGLGMVKWLKTLLNNVMTGDTTRDPFEKIKARTYGAQLGLNPKVWFYQLTSLMNGAEDVGFDYMGKGLAEFIKAPGKMLEKIEKESMLMRLRTIDPIFEARKRIKLTTLQKIGEATMRPIYWVDKWVASVVYLSAKQKFLAENPGATEAEAISAAEDVVGETQSMGNVLYQPQIKRMNKWVSGMSMYNTQQFQNFSRLTVQRVNAKNGYDKKAFAKAVITVVILPGIMLNIFAKGGHSDLIEAIKRMLNDDEDDDKKVMENITSLIGSMIQQAIPFMAEISSLMMPTNNGIEMKQFGAVTPIFKTLGKGKKLIEDPSVENAKKMFMQGGEAALNYNNINTSAIKRMWKGGSDIYSGKDVRWERLLASPTTLGAPELEEVTDPKKRITILSGKIKSARKRGDRTKVRELIRQRNMEKRNLPRKYT